MEGGGGACRESRPAADGGRAGRTRTNERRPHAVGRADAEPALSNQRTPDRTNGLPARQPASQPAGRPADPISRPPIASLPPGRTRPEEEEGRTSQLPRGADGRHGSARQESRPTRAALCLHRQPRGHGTLTGRRPGRRRRSPLAGRLREARGRGGRGGPARAKREGTPPPTGHGPAGRRRGGGERDATRGTSSPGRATPGRRVWTWGVVGAATTRPSPGPGKGRTGGADHRSLRTPAGRTGPASPSCAPARGRPPDHPDRLPGAGEGEEACAARGTRGRLTFKRRSDRRSPGRNPGPQVRSKGR